MAEWSKAAVLKTVSGVTRSGVRIPLPPPLDLLRLFRLQGWFSLHAVLRVPRSLLFAHTDNLPDVVGIVGADVREDLG